MFQLFTSHLLGFRSTFKFRIKNLVGKQRHYEKADHRRAAAQNLRQKGLNSQQIEQALETVYAPDENGESPELEAAAALVASRYRKKLADGRRDLVVAALQRRGFAYAVIKEAIRRTEEEL